MTGWETLLSSFGLSFASGINLYATVLVVGLAHRYGLVDHLPAPLEGLSNPWVLGAAGVLYALEFLADKFPFVATIWDGLHTLIRPLGGALMALGAAHELSPLGQAAALLIGGSIALGTHSTKAGFRMLANTAPEPVTHSAISVAEDVGVIGLTALALAYPWAALAVMVILFSAMVYIAPTIWRTARFLLSCTWGLASIIIGFTPRPDREIPEWMQEQLDRTGREPRGARAYRAFARMNVGGPRYGAGYVVISNGQVSFGREGLVRNTLQHLGAAESLSVESGIVCDIIVASQNENAPQMRVCLAKHWSGALQSELLGFGSADAISAS